MEITLDRLLESRDRRVARQQELLAAFPGCSLVCLTVQPPGPVKRSAESLIVGGAGVAALLERFAGQFSHLEIRDLDTGYEAYALLPLPDLEVKRICCEIEDTHPLGRLMDMDVLSAGSPAPLGREALGLAPRKCLLCDQPARFCMRARTHEKAALLARAKQMVNEFCHV